MKAIEQYFPVVLFNMLHKVVLTFEFVDEILKCDHSNESHWVVLSCCTIHQGNIPCIVVHITVALRFSWRYHHGKTPPGRTEWRKRDKKNKAQKFAIFHEEAYIIKWLTEGYKAFITSVMVYRKFPVRSLPSPPPGYRDLYRLGPSTCKTEKKYSGYTRPPTPSPGYKPPWL